MTRKEEIFAEYAKYKDEIEFVILQIAMPTGETESIVNPNVDAKMRSIAEEYDEDLFHNEINRKYIKEWIFNVSEDVMDFGSAIMALKEGKKVQRKGWNGKGIYIEMQTPDEHSKMTLPYIYIVTNGLVTDNQYAPKGVVPWLASQTDMLAEDWIVVE